MVYLCRNLSLQLALFALLLIFVGCSTLPAAAPTPLTEEPIPAADFSLPDLEGHTVTLSDVQGRWVLVNFWAIWCQPCLAEMPFLQSLNERYGDQLTVLAINMREPESEVQAFIAENNLQLLVLLQPASDTLLAYNVQGLPRTFVISPAGNIVRQQFGPLDPTEFEAWLVAEMTNDK